MTNIWFISVVLVALGRRLYRNPRPFTVAELFGWAPELRRISAAHRACMLLAQKGMLEPAPAPDNDPRANQIVNRPAKWQMTAIGREAARAAQLGAASARRSETLARLNSERAFPNSVIRRLWTVLITRRVLTANEAVELLGDAGEETQGLSKYIGRLLLHWHNVLPDTIQVSAKRVGPLKLKQYVLVGNVGRHPPDALRGKSSSAQASTRKRAVSAEGARP